MAKEATTKRSSRSSYHKPRISPGYGRPAILPLPGTKQRHAGSRYRSLRPLPTKVLGTLGGDGKLQRRPSSQYRISDASNERGRSRNTERHNCTHIPPYFKYDVISGLASSTLPHNTNEINEYHEVYKRRGYLKHQLLHLSPPTCREPDPGTLHEPLKKSTPSRSVRSYCLSHRHRPGIRTVCRPGCRTVMVFSVPTFHLIPVAPFYEIPARSPCFELVHTGNEKGIGEMVIINRDTLHPRVQRATLYSYDLTQVSTPITDIFALIVSQTLVDPEIVRSECACLLVMQIRDSKLYKLLLKATTPYPAHRFRFCPYTSC
ncbi:hypothetical protein ACRALDRAFT_211565 [Sodiomyces alcalophilus JCM 7366]|uniref:uncharacterized protein n=1 Tax=Sodiomyces alcalophilus JCM 7366 TaxID=591952 RepID=UPI0039B41943